MVLTSCFLEATEALPIRKTIVNVISGSANYPAPGMSAYCSAKAGLLMFTKCVAMEQEPRRYPARVVAFDPGMMDTPMQAEARRIEFPMNGFFSKAAAEGKLADAETVASRLLDRLDDAQNGEVISV
jgi:benzil reductase ((S)-benzoin forming)